MAGGRPTKYRKEYAEQAYELCLLGYTLKDLAKFFKVAKFTICRWLVSNQEFCDSVKRGRDQADGKVARAFYKRATGYTFKEVHTQAISTPSKSIDSDDIQDESFIPDESNGFKQIKVIEKEVAPDAGAALNWLKNRQPDKWRDKQQIEHSGDKANPLVVVSGMKIE